MIKLKELIKDECHCGKACCSVNESIKHISKAKKKLQRIMKDESSLRLHMWELVSIMSKDEVNKNLANQLKDTYKKNVTNFMRDVVRLVKGVK